MNIEKSKYGDRLVVYFKVDEPTDRSMEDVLYRIQLDIYHLNLYNGVRKIHFVINTEKDTISTIDQWAIVEFMKCVVHSVMYFQEITLPDQRQKIRCAIHLDRNRMHNCNIIRNSIHMKGFRISNIRDCESCYIPVHYDPYTVLFYYHDEPVE